MRCPMKHKPNDPVLDALMVLATMGALVGTLVAMAALAGWVTS